MSEHKDTNPKDAVGTGKVPFSTIPTEVVAELGLVMLEGARKYGRHNYRDAGVRASVYFDAAMRHWLRFWEGEDLDPDSGMPHLVHAMACAAVLRDSQFIGNWTDDRPPRLPDGWMAEFNEKAKAIVEKYPNPVPAHTEIEPELPLADWEKELLQAGRAPRVWYSLADVPVGVRVTHTADTDTICITREGYAYYVDKDARFPSVSCGWKIRPTDDSEGPFTEVIEEP